MQFSRLCSFLLSVVFVCATPALQAVCYTKSCLLKVIERACQDCKYDLVGELVCSVNDYDINNVVECLGSACVGDECIAQILFQIACKCPDKLKLWMCSLKANKTFEQLACEYRRAMCLALQAQNNPTSAPKNCTGDPLLELITFAIQSSSWRWYNNCNQQPQACPETVVDPLLTEKEFNLLAKSVQCDDFNPNCDPVQHLIYTYITFIGSVLIGQLAYTLPDAQQTLTNIWCAIPPSCEDDLRHAFARKFSKYYADNCGNTSFLNNWWTIVNGWCNCGDPNLIILIAEILQNIIRCGQQFNPCCDWGFAYYDIASRVYNGIQFFDPGVFVPGLLVKPNDPCAPRFGDAGCYAAIVSSLLDAKAFDVLATLFCSQPDLVRVLV